jgi:PPIC-type PPIASE domain
MGGPALHFALIGALLFVVVRAVDPAPALSESSRIVIPAQQVELARRAFPKEIGRLPTSEDEQRIVATLVDREVLFQYALRLGLHHQAAAQRRLAMIAGFVASNPDEAQPEAVLAEQAIELGLHQRDLVFRRMMIDAASRLIRAVMLAREPSEGMLEAYLRDHADAFSSPRQTRITQVAVSRLVHGTGTEAHAQAVLDALRRTPSGPEEAAALGDDFFVEPSLPALADGALARRFGHRFVRALRTLPTGTWSGPIPSRYGLHLVYVHERLEPGVPPLEEVRDRVRGALKEELAQAWFQLRLSRLRDEFDIVVEAVAS